MASVASSSDLQTTTSNRSERDSMLMICESNVIRKSAHVHVCACCQTYMQPSNAQYGASFPCSWLRMGMQLHCVQGNEFDKKVTHIFSENVRGIKQLTLEYCDQQIIHLPHARDTRQDKQSTRQGDTLYACECKPVKSEINPSTLQENGTKC